MRLLGVPQLLRALADMGYAGEPNLKLIGKEHVHELLISQAKRATKSALIREQKALNARRAHWLKRRGRIEATNGDRAQPRCGGPQLSEIVLSFAKSIGTKTQTFFAKRCHGRGVKESR